MNAKKCDRCSIYYDVPSIDGRHSIVEVCSHNGIGQVSYYDLCPECTTALIAWIRSAPNSQRVIDG